VSASAATLTGSWSHQSDIFDPSPGVFSITLQLACDSSGAITGSGYGSVVPTPGGNFGIEDITGSLSGQAVSLNGNFRSKPYGQPSNGTTPVSFSGTWDGVNQLKGTFSDPIPGPSTMSREQA
jgi:hypothetical protein